MGCPRKYSDELRRRAIDEVLERDRKVPEVAKQLGITTPETLRRWVVFKLVLHETGVTYNFFAEGYVRDITDRNGNKITFSYIYDAPSAEYFMASMTDTQGRVTTSPTGRDPGDQAGLVVGNVPRRLPTL